MDGVVFLVLLGLAFVAGYAINCWLWPFKNCTHCEGAGKFRPKSSSKVLKLCKRCKGLGRKLRVGRRLYNHWHREKIDATR